MDKIEQISEQSTVSFTLLGRRNIDYDSLVAHKADMDSLPDLSRGPETKPLSLQDWIAHVGIRSSEGVVIHPDFAKEVIKKLDGRKAFAEVGPSMADFYFAVENSSEDTKRRVGEFAVGVAKLIGGTNNVETLRLLKVKPEHLPS